MSDLRANTDLMRQGSNTLGNVRNQFHQICGEIATTMNQIDNHAYDGQLAKKVGEIMAGTLAQGAKIENFVGDLSKNLLQKATEIEMVNSVASSSAVNLAANLANLEGGSQAQASARLSGLHFDANNIFWVVTGFLGGLGFMRTGQTGDNFSGYFSNIHQTVSPTGYFIGTKNQYAYIYEDPQAKKHTQDALRSGQFVIKNEEKTLENGEVWYRVTTNGKSGWVKAENVTQATVRDTSSLTGEQVPSGEDGKDFAGYPRYAYGDKVKSNCTYYAASAVYKNSDGRVEMDGLGNGGSWATNAQTQINQYDADKVPTDNRKYLKVDTSPSAGDVYSNDTHHVAFVEQTWVSNDSKQIFVVVSEENAGTPALQYIGQPVGRLVTPIETSSDVARFRSVYVFNNVSSDPSEPMIAPNHGRFIHINYGYQPAVE